MLEINFIDRLVLLCYYSGTAKGVLMKKKLLKVLVVLTVVFMLNGFVFGKVIADLNEVLKPESIIADNNQLYIAEGTSVYIYSIKDFKLVKKFGKKGEGPSEFMGKIQKIVSTKDYLLISSNGKMSFYTKDGKFIKEMKLSGSMSMMNFFPLQTGFVGASMTVIDGKLFSTISLFDKKMKKKKVLVKFPMGTLGKIDVFGAVNSILFDVYKNKIYSINEKGGLSIFDDSGKVRKTIDFTKEKVKFTKSDEKEIRRLMKKEMPTGSYERVKHMFVFPEYFPSLLTVTVSNDIVYLITFKRENGKYETFLYDCNGKLIKKTYIDFKLRNGIAPYPFLIRNGKAYQLIENEDNEVWELHENKI